MAGTDFYQYLSCPRGSGGLEEHRQKDLHHVWALGRQVCMVGEAFYEMQARRAPMGYIPRSKLPLERT
jgi:hypothetical protein